jgi:hypothetical protein
MWTAGMGGGRFEGGNPDRLRQAFLGQGQEGLDQYRQRSMGGLQGPAPRGFDPQFYGNMRDSLYRLNMGQGHDPAAWINNGRPGPPMNDMLPNPGGGMGFETGGGYGAPGGGMNMAPRPGSGRRPHRNGQVKGGNGEIIHMGGPMGQRPMGKFANGKRMFPTGQGPGYTKPDTKPFGGAEKPMGTMPPMRTAAPTGPTPMSWPGSTPAAQPRPPGIYGIGPGGNSVSGGAQTYDQWQRPNQAQWFKREHGSGPEAFQAWQAATGRG